jgi:hypothetical protein
MGVACGSQSPPKQMACRWPEGGFGWLCPAAFFIQHSPFYLPEFSISAFQRFSFCQVNFQRCAVAAPQDRDALSAGLVGFGAPPVRGAVGTASNNRRQRSLLRQPSGTGTAAPGEISKAGTAS